MLKSPTASLKNQKYLKKPTNKQSLNTRNKSLSTSVLSVKSTPRDNGIKLKSAYYNDRRQIYLKQSRTLSEKSLKYQSKEISFSTRKKYSEERIEQIFKKNINRSEAYLKTGRTMMSLPKMEEAKERYANLRAKNYTQLINKQKTISVKKKVLAKEAALIRKQSNKSIKWSSPFKDTNTFKSKFQGKEIVAKKLEGIKANPNMTELKVLNLDRMFRKKDGVMGNVVPIPMIKMGQVNSKKNLTKLLKKKDPIHDVIEEYNKLLRITRMKKTKPRIGVRGHNFTKSPTLEQLMGIKIHKVEKEKKYQIDDENEIDEDVFTDWNQFYKKHIKKDIHLTRRLITGIKQDDGFNLGALTKFYSIFLNKIAPLSQKIKFLIYFFIPYGQQKIQFQVLKLILQLMCEQLPPIDNLTGSSQLLSKQEKSKIFLQALNRVLFSELQDYRTKQGNDREMMINRNILEIILERNEDAVDLLIKLLLIQ